MIPRIETDRLILRAPEQSDHAPYSAFWKSERSKFFGGPYGDVDIWYSFAADTGHWMLRGYGQWFVEDKASGTCAGWVGFNHPYHCEEAELGWTLFEDFLGRGYATEGARAALDYGRRHFDIPQPISLIDARNEKSVAVAERMGAALEDTREGETGTTLAYRHLTGAIQ